MYVSDIFPQMTTNFCKSNYQFTVCNSRWFMYGDAPFTGGCQHLNILGYLQHVFGYFFFVFSLSTTLATTALRASAARSGSDGTLWILSIDPSSQNQKHKNIRTGKVTSAHPHVFTSC